MIRRTNERDLCAAGLLLSANVQSVRPRVQFEDHYRSILEGLEQEDKVRFRYSTFGQLGRETT